MRDPIKKTITLRLSSASRVFQMRYRCYPEVFLTSSSTSKEKLWNQGTPFLFPEFTFSNKQIRIHTRQITDTPRIKPFTKK